MKAAFFDKDGPLVDGTGAPRIIPRDNVLMDRTLTGLRAIQKAGYALFIISNQGWIGTGKMTIDESEGIFQSVRAQYAAQGVNFTAHYFCPHVKANGCTCRKPETGMLERAFAEHDLTKEGSFMVGDMGSDIELARRFGITAVRVETPELYRGLKADYTVPDVNAWARVLLMGRI